LSFPAELRHWAGGRGRARHAHFADRLARSFSSWPRA
jgi:hypothetical protein